LNLRKAFDNLQERLWPAFKIGELAGSGRLPKALSPAPLNLLPNRSKGFELAGFKKLFANSKDFRAKRQRNY
jgi:hypothetical protein